MGRAPQTAPRRARAAENSKKTAKRPRGASAKPKGKPRGKPFPKGVSGNPGGRPPLPPEYKDSIGVLAKRGLEVLEEVLNDPRHFRREQAAEYVVNRAHGTPVARSQVTGPGGGPIQVANLTTAERKERIAVLVAKRNAALADLEDEGEEDPDRYGTASGDAAAG